MSIFKTTRFCCPKEVECPTKGFQQLELQHKEELPCIYIEQIDMYFVHRLAGLCTFYHNDVQFIFYWC